MQIRRMEEEMIYPAPSTKHPELHRLSENDQRPALRAAVPKLYFYQEGPGSCDGLKSALSKTLAVFYPLAGRLEERRSAEPEGRADVRCSAQGALFCEAWTDSSLAQAFPPSLQPHPDFHLLLVPHHSHIPLRIQVTHFGCGAMCLCVQNCHALCDGASSAHFIDSWAETTIGKDSFTLYPCFNEAPLEVRYALKGPLDPSCIALFQKEEIAEPSATRNLNTRLSRIFHFTPTFINFLKNCDNYANTKYTSFECISAYLWKNVILAQATPPCEEACLSFTVEGRKKFNPPLPQGYFGNVVFQTRATTLARNLVEKPLPHVADLIKEASKRVNDGYMRTFLHILGQQDPPMDIPGKSSRILFLNSWKEFPMYKVNFGWGNPFCFRTPPFPSSLGKDCIVLFPSSLGKDYIDAFVCLEIEHMEKLESLIHQAPIGGFS